MGDQRWEWQSVEESEASEHDETVKLRALLRLCERLQSLVGVPEVFGTLQCESRQSLWK